MKRLLFSLLLMTACIYGYSEQLSKGMERTASNSIWAKFLGETRNPIIYRNDIDIKVTGDYTKTDISLLNELVDTLRRIIPGRKIAFTSGTGNLTFKFSEYPGAGSGLSTYAFGNDIRFTEVMVVLKPDLSREDRKKIIYYYLYRSLVHYSISKKGSTTINGSVFDEKDPDRINFTPADPFMIHLLYSDDFQKEFRILYLKDHSFKMYLTELYAKELKTFFFLLGLISSLILLFLFMQKGVFKPHHWSWSEFNKQGLYLILTASPYVIFNSLSDLMFQLYLLKALAFLLFIIKSVIAINLIYLIEKNALKNYSSGSLRIILSFITTLLVLLLVAFPTNFIYNFTFNGIKIEPLPLSLRIENEYKFYLPYIFIIATARTLFIYLNDRYRSILNEKDVELARISELHKRAELQSLQAKINPHFLYNSLNSIASLASTDAHKTEQMALSLSDFYKYAINREQNQFNPLSEELKAIQTYLDIEKVRFGDRLNYQVDCPEDLLPVQIPRLLIQPLVENAVKHGLSKITGKGLIRITVERKGEQIGIKIYDNGPDFPKEPLSGYGIQNTQERLALIYKESASITWHNGDDKHIEVIFPV